jgi:RES domain-containing protein
MAEQIFYRALRPAWSFKPLSGAGAARNGGRWNAKGTPALYLAEDPMTALAEYNQDFSFRRMPGSPTCAIPPSAMLRASTMRP